MTRMKQDIKDHFYTEIEVMEENQSEIVEVKSLVERFGGRQDQSEARILGLENKVDKVEYLPSNTEKQQEKIKKTKEFLGDSKMTDLSVTGFEEGVESETIGIKN